MNPSVRDYERLLNSYGNRIDCPCSKIAISFASITQLNVTFHPACTSEHVNGFWWPYYLDGGEYVVYWLSSSDVRQWASSYLIWIASFCSLANTTILTAIENFRANSLITQQAWSRLQFHSQLNTTITQFRMTSRQNFEQSIQFYQDIAQSDSLLSLFAMNWNFNVTSSSARTNGTVRNEPIHHNTSCSCATSRHCLQPAAIFSHDDTLIHTIDGMMHGCFFIESFLASSLSCFYSNSCLHDLVENMNEGAPSLDYLAPWVDLLPVEMLEPMDATLLKRFTVDDTFATIVSEAFVDLWSVDASYDDFFRECAPSYCSYTKTERFKVLYIITMFLSFYGGFTLVFRISIPILVPLILQLKRKCCTEGDR